MAGDNTTNTTQQNPQSAPTNDAPTNGVIVYTGQLPEGETVETMANRNRVDGDVTTMTQAELRALMDRTSTTTIPLFRVPEKASEFTPER